MIFVLLAIVAVIALVAIPAIATSIARNVANHLDRSPSSGNIDQSIIEARLGRIEEAIDAMATQIERLTDQQRALIGKRERVTNDE